MPDQKQHVSVWINFTARRQLKKIAAETNESQGDVLERLLAVEYTKVFPEVTNGSRARPAVARV
jgi:hypothetical protein